MIVLGSSSVNAQTTCSTPYPMKSYYISPTGSDSNTGIDQSHPIATFNHAWQFLCPGDTLWLMDGTYYQVIEPTINGISGSPITIKALNDGKAIIDGEYIRSTVVIGKNWNDIANYNRDTINPYGNHLTVEGIVAKNSLDAVFVVLARNVILRRCSGYNANTHNNDHVITVWSLGTPAHPANVLVEDCVAAGSGRKMILAYDTYVNVVFRRNFAAWQTWLGDNFCGGYWPQSDGIEIYPKAYEDQPDVLNNSLNENNIQFGLIPDYGTSLSPNPGLRTGNYYYGDMSLGAGMRWDNTQRKFVIATMDNATCTYNGISKPAACANSNCIDLKGNTSYRAGFVIATFGNPLMRNNIFKDLFAYGNAGLGIIAGPWGSSSSNNQLTNFFSSRRRHTRSLGDWSSDVCSSDLIGRAHV